MNVFVRRLSVAAVSLTALIASSAGAQGLPAAKDIIQRYAKEINGDAWKGHTSARMKATMEFPGIGMKADIEVLRGAGCEVSAPDTGCCGMGGSFGYRPEFYEASKRIAGLELLPAIAASPGAAIVADGFSCREQIEGLAGRPTLHLAELLAR